MDLPYFNDPQVAAWARHVQEQLGRLGRHSITGPQGMIVGPSGVAIRPAAGQQLQFMASSESTSGIYANGTNAFPWAAPYLPPATPDLSADVSNQNFTSAAGGLYWINAIGQFIAATPGDGWVIACTQEFPQQDIAELRFDLVITLAAGGTNSVSGTTCRVGYIGTNGLSPIGDPDVLGSGDGYYVLQSYGYPVGGPGPSYFQANVLPPGSTIVNTLVYLNPGDAFKINLVNGGTSSQPAYGYGNSLVCVKLADSVF